MNAHDLAKLLLDGPNLPIATHTHSHTYMSAAHAGSHGPLKVGLLESYAGQHIVIGNIMRRQINPPNEWISKMLHGDAPEQFSDWVVTKTPPPSQDTHK